MKKGTIKALAVGVFTLSSATAFAGGLLTNTNQSISFLRNPARDAAIGIDGVYSNPAGVAFMKPGFHLGLNWQMAAQTRTVLTTNPNYALGVNNNGIENEYKGKAFVPFLPSVQAAYNTDKWSFQFNFAVHGGGGRCEFADGLGSFENAVSNIAGSLVGLTNQIGMGYNSLVNKGIPGIQTISPVNGYSFDQSMEGKQYYFGFTLGAAYKINEHLSVYGGVRALYGTASYKAKLENIKVRNTAGELNGLKEYFGGVAPVVANNAPIINGVVKSQLDNIKAAYGVDDQKAMQLASQNEDFQKLLQLQGVPAGLAQKTELLDQYADGVNLQSDQSAFGIAPIIGVDYKVGNFNFAAKYEFKVCMQMKNKSTVDKVSAIDAVNKFKDGTSVHEDSPAMLSLGAQWQFLPQARVSLGYHHFYDKQSKKYNNEQDLLKSGTNEYLGGIEFDFTKKLTASAGLQITRYGITDEFMNDMSYVVNSWSYGVGLRYQLSEKVAIEAAYFKTKYEHYNRTTAANPSAQPAATPEIKDDFTRSNRVFGVGVTMDF